MKYIATVLQSVTLTEMNFFDEIHLLLAFKLSKCNEQNFIHVEIIQILYIVVLLLHFDYSQNVSMSFL